MTEAEIHAHIENIRGLDLIPAWLAIEIAGLAGAANPYQAMQYWRSKLNIEVHFNGWYKTADAYRIREQRKKDR